MLSSPRETKGRLRREVIEAIKVRRGEGRELTTIGRRRARRVHEPRLIVLQKGRMILVRRVARVRVEDAVSAVKEVVVASVAFRRALCRAECEAEQAAACEAEQAAATVGSARAE
jgi:hypothetical protein